MVKISTQKTAERIYSLNIVVYCILIINYSVRDSLISMQPYMGGKYGQK